ncbi:hypothetical protein MNB_SUP05-4-1085 [hydrothermal vent metagenome]|uniref:Uncharacterized protein n=1 Tax=hydrothermal vent metagenome TaxID=652676 RepID=A0A1W1DB16_9ZZZZ
MLIKNPTSFFKIEVKIEQKLYHKLCNINTAFNFGLKKPYW